MGLCAPKTRGRTRVDRVEVADDPSARQTVVRRHRRSPILRPAVDVHEHQR